MDKDKELEEAIDECNKFIYAFKKRDVNGIDGFEIKAIETILQSLEEVTEERDIYLRQLNKAFDNGFISKEKIEDKLEEYKEKYNNSVNNVYKNPTEALINFQRIIGGKEVLQELLEDK